MLREQKEGDEPCARSAAPPRKARAVRGSTPTVRGKRGRFYIGIDIGYREHVACCVPASTFESKTDKNLWRKAKCLHFPSTSRGFITLNQYLSDQGVTSQRALILLEPTGGHYGAPLIHHLQQAGFLVYQVANSAVTHYRAKLLGGETKTDEMDARLMARMAFLHDKVGEEFTILPVTQRSGSHLFLKSMVDDRRRLRRDLTRCEAQLLQLLAATFPELKTVFTSSPAVASARALLKQYPSPQELGQASEEQVRRVLAGANNKSHLKRAKDIIECARLSKGLPATDQTRWRQSWILQRIDELEESIARIEERIEFEVKGHPYTAILQSFPECGIIATATLIATIVDITRFKGPASFKAYVGYCPRQQQSGSSVDSSSLTRGGNRTARSVLFQMIWMSLPRNHKTNPFKEYYSRLVSRGMPPLKAVGHACGKLAAVMYSCLLSNKPYDPTIHRKTLGLSQKGSNTAGNTLETVSQQEASANNETIEPSTVH